MSGLGAELEDFLANVVDQRALAEARQVCIDENIYTLDTLVDLWNNNLLESMFRKGTASIICKRLLGQSCLGNFPIVS